MRLYSRLLVLPLFVAAVYAADVPVVESRVREASLPRDIVTNEGIVLMSDAGFSDSFIVEKILLSRTRFDTSVEGVTYLRRNFISEEMIQFILERSVKPPVTAAAMQVPANVPMKIIKQKVLVPVTTPYASPYAPASPVMVSAPPDPYLNQQWVWLHNNWYAAYPPVGAPYGSYTLPGHPVLQSPAYSAYPAAPSAPIMSPVATPYGWVAVR